MDAYILNTYNIHSCWAGYASASSNYTKPEKWLSEHTIPEHITTVVDVGCGNGRNFLAFEDKKYIGIDLFPIQTITWVCDIYKLTYYQCSILEFIKSKYFNKIDWKHTLVMSHGTLMYLDNKEEQEYFLNVLLQSGCNNFILHEYAKYPPGLSEYARAGKLGFLDLSETHSKLFDKIIYRDPENFFTAHIKLT